MNTIPLDEHDKATIANVSEHGCEVLYVFDKNAIDSSFSYSIGFAETIHQPDVIVFGLPRRLMHHMVNEVYRQGKHGLIFADGVCVSGLVEGFKCVLKAVHHSNITADYFGTGFWYYSQQQLPKMTDAFQIVWPGKIDGLYPWDIGCDSGVTDQQTPLYLERAVV